MLNKFGRLFKIILLIISIIICEISESSGPVIFFSDLVYGPNSGWEGIENKGALVTIWGEGFGNVGYDGVNNYVTVGGIEITEYAEWGSDLGPARSLDRISFWLNNNVPEGETEIRVTVNGIESNSISFTVGDAMIYFISVNDGDNNYNGLFSNYQGGNNGPFRDIKMFNPAYNPSGWNEPFIVYVRGGVYTEQDIEGTFVALKAPPDSPDLPRALIGYAGEEAILDMSQLQRSAIWSGAYSPYKLSYSLYTIARLKFINGKVGCLLIGGYNNRFIGNIFANNNEPAWSGVIMVREANHQYIFGNYFFQNGYDSYKHEIYVKTHLNPPGVSEYVYIGWNEFDSWTADLNPDDQPSRGGAIFVSTASDAFEKGITNNIYIFSNYFHGGDSEPFYNGNGGGKDIYIFNNIFSNIHPEVTRGIYFGGSAPGVKNIYFYNNVLYNVGNIDSPMILVANAPTLNVISKNNIFYAQENQPFVRVEPYNGATFTSTNDLYYGNSQLPEGENIEINNPITSDPRFRNPQLDDFHILSDSPCIDAGLNSLPYLDSFDFYGNTRILDGNNDNVSVIDIGANEYDNENISPTPVVPTLSLSGILILVVLMTLILTLIPLKFS